MYIKTASSARTDCAKTYRKHSNRQAVGELSWSADANASGPQTAAPNTGTAFIVTSAGGPIGYQNLAGELSSWTGRPPAGTLLNPLSGRITQVKTERCHLEGKDKGLGYNEKPRLCVALDYLHVMSGLPEKGGIAVPLTFQCLQPGYPASISVFLSAQMRGLGCIESVKFWLFERDDKAGTGQWVCIKTTLKAQGKTEPAVLKLSGEELVVLNRAVSGGVMERFANSSKFEKGKEFLRITQAFVEVALKKPASSKAPEDWARDMQCTDPWVFPLHISIDSNLLSPKSYWSFQRPAGERGEVPDWAWLYKTWGETPSKAGNLYPKAEEIIRLKKEPKVGV